MRAKEYIELYKNGIKHIEIIKSIINDLLPLRKDKNATDKYYNEKLSADIRRKNYLMQKELYDKKHSIQTSQPLFEEFSDEISFDIAYEVRNELFNVISGDASFGYIYFLLGTEQNSKRFSEPIDCIPNKERIEKAISDYRDDYPKLSLDDYLDDNFNFQEYHFLTKEKYSDDPAIFLNFFNRAYMLYDRLRCYKNKISDVRQLCHDTQFPNGKDKYYTVLFIVHLIDNFNNDDERLQRIKVELQSQISSLCNEQNDETMPHSPIFLSQARGTKVNFIRIVNVLSEMGYFVDKNGNKCTKKDIFRTLGMFVNKDLSSFQNDLSTTTAASNADMKSTIKIFEDMLAKQEEINRRY